MRYRVARKRWDQAVWFEIGKTAFCATPCTYCGQPATETDHVFPRAVAAWRTDCTDASRWIVPCCGECNLIAGDRVFGGITEKRAFIHARIAEENAKLLEAPTWTKDEIDSLGPTLRSYILALQEKQAAVRCRLAWRGIAPGAAERSRLAGPGSGSAK